MIGASALTSQEPLAFVSKRPSDEVVAAKKDIEPALLARCRLKDASKWFAHRGWKELPRGKRGWRILRWGADHAWLAASTNPHTSVRRCRKWAPWLTDDELDKIVADTKQSNQRWSADQSATILGISVTHRTMLKLWHFGASDDPDYEVRLDIQRANAAKRARLHRAKYRITGASASRSPNIPASPRKMEGYRERRRGIQN